MSLEPCPFCGKPFKRLKSHLPHCKMSPDSTTANNKVPKELPTAKHKTPNKKDKNLQKTNKTSNLQTKPKSQVKSAKVRMDKSFPPNPFFKLANTVAKDLSEQGENLHTVKPKSKWLVKRDQEILHQVTLLKQNGSKFISDPQQEEPNKCPETSKSLIEESQKTEKRPKTQDQKRHKGTSFISVVTSNKTDITSSNVLHGVPCTDSSQAEQNTPPKKANQNFLKKTQDIPKALNMDSLVSRIKYQENSAVFQTKTCVWDHIKNSLYNKRFDFRPVVYSTVATHKVSVLKSENNSASVCLPCVEKNQYPICQNSVQRPTENLSSSKFQSITAMGLSPEMATGYGITLLPLYHSRISSNVCTKCQTLKPRPENQGPVIEQKLGGVKLNELGAQTPKSPREAMTLLNKDWLWYYRKYIDVQKGRIGGLAMLIAGYCVLSYAWSHPHFKKER